MRNVRFLLMLVVLVLLASASLRAGAMQDAPRTARVRVGYFAFDPKGYDTYVDSESFPFATQIDNDGWSFSCFSIRCNTASPFFEFPQGTHSIAIAPKGKNLDAAILGPKKVALEADHAYSLAIVGSIGASNLDFLVIDDTKILGSADPKNTFASLLVNNIAGIPAFEIAKGTEKELVKFGQFSGTLYPADQAIHFVMTATGNYTALLMPMDSVPVPGRTSDLAAMFGSYPGTYDRDYFFAANWGYPGKITILDGGAISVGSEVSGDIAAITQRMRYSLTLPADTTLNLYVTGTGIGHKDTVMLGVTMFDPAMYIFDATGKLLVWGDDVSQTIIDPKLEGISLKAGTYRIEVGGSFDLVSGPFKLRIEVAKPS